MASYSIKDLEKLSGIKAHTIRIWEKRYRIIEPKRTKTNIRYYCDEDLKKILNISILNKSGIKISHIAKLSPKDINERIVHLSQEKPESNIQIDNLLVAMLELDEAKFDKTLSKSILEIGFEETITKIVFVFLNKIGILWQTGSINPAQEHFISNLIRQKIITAIDNITHSYFDKSKKFILFLPEGELHELGMLFNYYIIKKQKHKVIYLGQSVPFPDLIEIANIHQPDYLVTSFTSNINKVNLKNYLFNLSNSFQNQKILISGAQLKNISFKLPENIDVISSIKQFKKAVLTK